MKTIRMKVKNGQCTIETEGFSGGGCIRATQPLKQLIGEEVGDPELTDEYFQEDLDERSFEHEEF